MCALVVDTSVRPNCLLLGLLLPGLLVLAGCAKGVEITPQDVVVLQILPADGQNDAGASTPAPTGSNVPGLPAASSADAGNAADASAP
jgi:hypothetical protein